MKVKYTIKDFNVQFPDDRACMDFIFATRYPDGGTCKCGKSNCFHPVAKRRSYACAWCGAQIYPTSGTIFHKSETSLKTWFFAMFLMSSSKNGVAALEIQRQTGVTYKTAHRMGHKIRQLMQAGGDMMTGIVEADETYIGGKAKNMHALRRKAANIGTGGKGKIPVIGIAERGGDVQAKVVTKADSKTVLPNILENVAKGTTVCTDEHRIYSKLKKKGFNHEQVAHGAREYVRGHVHTNSIEGFWSQFKRSVDGTFHHVSRQHLQSYVNEFGYRHNLRQSERPIFADLSGHVAEQHA